MTLNASLRSRVKRLEQFAGRQQGIAERMNAARLRWLAMTPAEQAAKRCRHVGQALASLDLPDPVGDDSDARMLRMRRRHGRRHLLAMAALSEPDLNEPANQFDLQAHHAWWDQRERRKEALAYLADVALAGELLKKEAT